MLIEDVVKQLWAVVPLLTNLFTDELALISITSSGTTATVTTSVAHGLTTGDIANISGSKVPLDIVSLTQVDNLVTAETTSKHDLTEGFADTTVSPIEIIGATETDYNGIFPLLTQTDRTHFTYQITGDPSSPATGSPQLLENLKFGYNGLHTVTVTGATTFSYSLKQPLGSPAAGTIICRVRPRIAGVINVERAGEAYTKQGANKLWAFVTLDERVANKSRATTNDAVDDPNFGTAYRQYVLHPFSIYIFIPTSGEIGAEKARDLADKTLSVFCTSVTGITFSSEFSQPPYSRTVYESDNFSAYTDAFYVHQYIFQASEYITFFDTAGIDFGVAFRDIDVSFDSDFTGLEIMTDSINLDEDEP